MQFLKRSAGRISPAGASLESASAFCDERPVLRSVNQLDKNWLTFSQPQIYYREIKPGNCPHDSKGRVGFSSAGRPSAP
jgi:hypothetical protein